MKRFSVKFFVKGAVTFETQVLIPIFHQWIQNHSLTGLLIDVADYRHVPQGPSIMLVGHEGDYVFDERNGEAGLNYVHKRGEAQPFTANLKLAFAQAKTACQLLEAEPTLNGLQFDYNTVHITFLDRLVAPNRPEIFEGLQGDLQQVFGELYGTSRVQLASLETDHRKCLLIEATNLV